MQGGMVRLGDRFFTGSGWVRALALCVMVPLCVACSTNERDMVPDVLRIGILPLQAPEATQARYQPLVDHLAATVGVPCRLVPVASYADLLKKIERREVELAYLGGVTFVLAHAQSGVVPLVMRKRDIHYTSYFLVRAGHSAQTLADLNGTRLAFGSRLSTSGHLMPRHFLVEQGLEPESFFGEIAYTGSHDRTALSVRDGRTDVGAASADIVQQMYADGRLSRKAVRVLWETPSYADYVWVVDRALDEGLVTRLRDAFLMLDSGIPEHKQVLESVGARVFMPALSEEFSLLADIVRQQRIDPQEANSG